MKSIKDGYGYNERLFSGGLRSKLHLARFHWVASEIVKQNCKLDSVLELGCFDGKLLDFLPVTPSRYVGIDANWEGGLDMAKKRWANVPNLSFIEASTPEEISFDDGINFTAAVVMETLEHVSPDQVDGYLRKIALHLNGYLFITVPNEKGIVFLAKWLIKKTLGIDEDKYRYSELMNAFLGRMERVERNQHKGFDYNVVINTIMNHFDVVEVTGHPLGFLPRSLCFGIGIVAKSKEFSPSSL